MKLYSLIVMYKGVDAKVRKLSAAYELNSFGYFQRGSVKEFMDFTSKIIVERTNIAQRASVKEQEYMCHTYVRSDSLAGVLISDNEYPQRVCFTLLNKVLDEFTSVHPPHSWPGSTEDALTFPKCQEYLAKYQNPREADAMTKLQDDLDETKIILHDTIEKVLQRGEKLDDLVDKSEGLSMQSRAFYKTYKDWKVSPEQKSAESQSTGPSQHTVDTSAPTSSRTQHDPRHSPHCSHHSQHGSHHSQHGSHHPTPGSHHSHHHHSSSHQHSPNHSHTTPGSHHTTRPSQHDSHHSSEPSHHQQTHHPTSTSNNNHSQSHPTPRSSHHPPSSSHH